MPYDNSDYYHYYNQKYDLPQPMVMTDLTSAKDVIEAYNKGTRIFNNISIENESFVGQDLRNITFENSRLYADFRNANLENAIFKNGHIKTSNFQNANLTNAHFENLGVERAEFKGATVDGFVFKKNSAYGNNDLNEADFLKFFDFDEIPIPKPAPKTIVTTKIETEAIIEKRKIMKVEFWVIGKTSFDYLDDGNEIYLKRLKHYVPFKMVTIPDIKNRKSLSEQQIKTKEGETILSKVNHGDYLILMDERGKQRGSEELADYLQQLFQQSYKRIIFVIGGAYGFSDKVYNRCNTKMSLSKMTFSHQMVRLIFLEQFYRAMTIMKNEPYHHK